MVSDVTWRAEALATVQLTSGGIDLYPQWSPDGKKLLFDSGRGGKLDLWVVDVDT
jgi:Tol biopolymer transport system component